MAEEIPLQEFLLKLRPIPIMPKVSFKWTIRNFNLLKRKTGERLLSPIFTLGDNDEYKFRIVIYPNGLHKAGLVSLFVMFLPDEETHEVLVTAQYFLLNEKQEVVRTANFDRYEFTMHQRDQGWPYFAADIFLNNPKKFLLKDSLIVECHLYMTDDTRSNVVKAPKCPIIDDLSGLFDSMEFSDVTLVTPGREFQAHKAILAMRSPVFSAMFDSDMLEKNENKVKIEDVDDAVLMELLRFIYTGKVMNLDCDLADSLLVAAEKYALNDLHALCEKALIEGLTFENAARTLIISDLHRCVQLKPHVSLFISVHAAEIAETPGYQSMCDTHSYLINEIFQVFARCKVPKMPKIFVES